MEAYWDAKRQQELQDRAQALGVTVETAAAIEIAEYQATAATEQAKDLLVHYFSVAGLKIDWDMRSELDALVDSISGRPWQRAEPRGYRLRSNRSTSHDDASRGTHKIRTEFIANVLHA